MTVQLATERAPDRPVNEDNAFAAAGLVGVLDGVSSPDGVETGCRHGPAWYVKRLADHLVRLHREDQDVSLTAMLAEAIRRVGLDHEGQCDLNHPGTPASTVCLLK